MKVSHLANYGVGLTLSMALPFALLLWGDGIGLTNSASALGRDRFEEQFCTDIGVERRSFRDSGESLCFESEIALNFYILENFLVAAGLSPDEIATVMQEIGSVGEQIGELDVGVRNLNWVVEDYIKYYQAATLIRIAAEQLFPDGFIPSGGMAANGDADDFSADSLGEWSGEIQAYIGEQLEIGDLDSLFGEETPEIFEIATDLLQPGLWGRFDIPLGEREGFIDMTVSGSDREGWAVPCLELSDCNHIELASDTFPLLHGRRWVGAQQMVRGGKNPPLELLNGGVEPTGRLPFHENIKIVVQSVDEARGEVQFASYLNFCITFAFYESCSPYFIGPLPWLSAREGDFVLVGFGGAPPVNLPPPGGYPDVPNVATSPTPAPTPSSTPEPISCETLSHPAPGYPVTSRYGNRYHPVYKVWKIHTGIDIGTPIGTPVKAACDGVVFLAEWRRGYGYYLGIRHDRGLSTGYAHLSEFKVSVGDTVSAGDTVALSGASGVGTGPHLHFEVWEGGNHQNPENYGIDF